MMASMKKSALTLFALLATLQVSMGGVVHKVGEGSGWTSGGVDYKKWAASKTFNIGDNIVFEYDAKFHNVVQVSYQDYKKCNVPERPMATYNKGSDSIPIKSYGHYFYICGAPGHCQAGQKVDIRVVPNSPAVTPPPPEAHSPTPSPSPSPSPSHAHSKEATPDDKSTASPYLNSSLGDNIIRLLIAFFGLAYLAF